MLEVYQTCGINEAIASDELFTSEIEVAFSKFRSNDWGDTCKSDKQLNNNALKSGNRIVALYNTSKGRVFIITEYGHMVTTILFGYEY